MNLVFPAALSSVVTLLGISSSMANVNESKRRDIHSYANPEHVRVRHLELDLDVLFDERILRGDALLTIDRASGDRSRPLMLDTKSIDIARVETSSNKSQFDEAPFQLGPTDRILGVPLSIGFARMTTTFESHIRPVPKRQRLEWLSARSNCRRQTAVLIYPIASDPCTQLDTAPRLSESANDLPRGDPHAEKPDCCDERGERSERGKGMASTPLTCRIPFLST